MFDNDLKPTITKEKELRGEDGDVLRLVTLDPYAPHPEVTRNNIRLVLSVKGAHDGIVLGGNGASDMSSEDCDRYFEEIKSSSDFRNVSDIVRRQVGKAVF